MPISLVIRGMNEAIRYLDTELPTRLAVGVNEQMMQSAMSLAAAARGRIGGGGPLRDISGTLRQSLQAGVEGSPGVIDGLQWSVFSNVHYAGIQEVGGVVTAKKAYRNVPGGPYLNIPIGINKLQSGATSKSAKEVFAEGGYIIQSRRGNWIVMLRGEPQFVLKRSVVIPGRLGLMVTSDVDNVNLAEEELPLLIQRLRTIPLD